MESISKTFYDVEHEGDIEEIYTIITEHGGVVTQREFDYEGERLSLVFQVPNPSKFLNDVRGTYWFGQ